MAACWAGIQSLGFCFSGHPDSPSLSFLLALVWIWLALDDTGMCLWGSVLISSLGLLRQELLFQPGWNFSMETSCFIRFLHNPRLENVLNRGPKPSMHLRKVSISDPLIKLCLSVGDGDPSTKMGGVKEVARNRSCFCIQFTSPWMLAFLTG